MFRFNDIDWLWALLVVPALASLFLSAARGRARALEQFADAELVERLTASVHHSARRWKLDRKVSSDVFTTTRSPVSGSSNSR